MSKAGATWRDEYELLCERCGYSIEGLPRETNCPECGKPVVESVPEARPGTAWQQGPSFRSWLATIAGSLCSPRATARSVRIEPQRAASLHWTNVTVAAGLVTLVPASIYAIQSARGEAPYPLPAWTWPWEGTPLSWLGVILMLLVWWTAMLIVLAFLTDVEAWGIRTFGRIHGRRITRTVARTITAHATAGWVVAAGFVSAGFLVGLLAYELAMHRNVEPFRGTLMLAPIWMPTILGLIGLLAFETIVYVGVLNCGYANRTRPEHEP